MENQSKSVIEFDGRFKKCLLLATDYTSLSKLYKKEVESLNVADLCKAVIKMHRTQSQYGNQYLWQVTGQLLLGITNCHLSQVQHLYEQSHQLLQTCRGRVLIFKETKSIKRKTKEIFSNKKRKRTFIKEINIKKGFEIWDDESDDESDDDQDSFDECVVSEDAITLRELDGDESTNVTTTVADESFGNILDMNYNVMFVDSEVESGSHTSIVHLKESNNNRQEKINLRSLPATAIYMQNVRQEDTAADNAQHEFEEILNERQEDTAAGNAQHEFEKALNKRQVDTAADHAQHEFEEIEPEILPNHETQIISTRETLLQIAEIPELESAIRPIRTSKKRRLIVDNKNFIATGEFTVRVLNNDIDCKLRRSDVISKKAILQHTESQVFVRPMFDSPCTLSIFLSNAITKKEPKIDESIIREMLYGKEKEKEKVTPDSVDLNDNNIRYELDILRGDININKRITRSSVNNKSDETFNKTPPIIESNDLVELQSLTLIENEPEICLSPPLSFHNNSNNSTILNQNTVGQDEIDDEQTIKRFDKSTPTDSFTTAELEVLNQLLLLWRQKTYPIGIDTLIKPGDNRMKAAKIFSTILSLKKKNIIEIETAGNSKIFNITKARGAAPVIHIKIS